MPVMDGLAATTEIRALDGDKSRIPIIGVTANAMKGDREKYLDAGMNAYVTKPIDPYELATAVASLCDVTLGPAKPAAASEPAAEPPQNDLSDLMETLDGLTGTDG
jgi:CheY-like chemotaxis protein